MRTWKRLQHAAALMAGFAWLLPAPAWAGDGKKTASAAPATKVAPKAIVPDIMLTKEGVLRGSLIDGDKQPLAKTKVILKRDGKLVTTAETNEKGIYEFPGLKSGPYQLEINEQTVAIRTWKPAVAPPKSLKQLDMAYVPDSRIVRAQFGYFDPVNTTLLLLGVTGVVLGGVAIAEINEVEDQVEKLQSP